MTTAFVLSGAGSLGAVQVGMLQAFTERRPAGEETTTITGIQALNEGMPSAVDVTTGSAEFGALGRIDTPADAAQYRHGGIVPYVLRHLLDQRVPSEGERSL